MPYHLVESLCPVQIERLEVQDQHRCDLQVTVVNRICEYKCVSCQQLAEHYTETEVAKYWKVNF